MCSRIITSASGRACRNAASRPLIETSGVREPTERSCRSPPHYREGVCVGGVCGGGGAVGGGGGWGAKGRRAAASDCYFLLSSTAERPPTPSDPIKT